MSILNLEFIKTAIDRTGQKQIAIAQAIEEEIQDILNDPNYKFGQDKLSKILSGKRKPTLEEILVIAQKTKYPFILFLNANLKIINHLETDLINLSVDSNYQLEIEKNDRIINSTYFPNAIYNDLTLSTTDNYRFNRAYKRYKTFLESDYQTIEFYWINGFLDFIFNPFHYTATQKIDILNFLISIFDKNINEIYFFKSNSNIKAYNNLELLKNANILLEEFYLENQIHLKLTYNPLLIRELKRKIYGQSHFSKENTLTLIKKSLLFLKENKNQIFNKEKCYHFYLSTNSLEKEMIAGYFINIFDIKPKEII